MMDMGVWLLLVLIMTLAIAIDALWEVVRERRRIRRLVASVTGRERKQESLLLAVAGRLLGWYGRPSLPDRLAQAGNPRLIGESQAHFYAAKLILGVLVGLRLGGSDFPFLAYGLAGFMLPDGLLYLAARKRKEEIRRALPDMLDFLRRALAGGAGMRETLAALPDRLSGPLREEVMRLAASYALTLDLPRSLDAFAQRTGLEEVDHLVLALKQSEITGRVKTLLARQSELLKARQQAEEEKGARNRANFLPLVSVMVMANIMILVVMLLMLVVLNLLPPIFTAYQYSNLTRVHRQTLLGMEVAGGLTPALEQKVRDDLAGWGFDTSQVEISGTPAVVDYGGAVNLAIRYRYTYRNYAFSNFLLYPVDTPQVMTAEGSSVSFNFQK